MGNRSKSQNKSKSIASCQHFPVVLANFKSPTYDISNMWWPIEYIRKLTLYFLAIVMWAFTIRFFADVIEDPRSISMAIMFLIDGILFFQWARTEHGDANIHFGQSSYPKIDTIIVTPLLAAVLAFVIAVVMS